MGNTNSSRKEFMQPKAFDLRLELKLKEEEERTGMDLLSRIVNEIHTISPDAALNFKPLLIGLVIVAAAKPSPKSGDDHGKFRLRETPKPIFPEPPELPPPPEPPKEKLPHWVVDLEGVVETVMPTKILFRGDTLAPRIYTLCTGVTYPGLTKDARGILRVDKENGLGTVNKPVFL
jgi:hypothetical protein